MGLIKKIKETIFKVKDYDRLESDYCEVLDMVTGGMLSMPNYTMESVHKAFHEYLEQRDKEVCKPTAQVEDILNTIGKNATWMVVSLNPCCRYTHFFRDGHKVRKEDLNEDERWGFETWIHIVHESLQIGSYFDGKKEE